MPPASWSVRLAHEQPDGLYAVVAEEARVALSSPSLAPTLTLSERSATLLHVALRSVLVGASGKKLMLVPTDRGRAWLIEFGTTAAAAEASAALAARGTEVVRESAEEPAQPQMTGDDLEKLVLTPSFRATLAEMEGALARRKSLGLPDLLA